MEINNSKSILTDSFIKGTDEEIFPSFLMLEDISLYYPYSLDPSDVFLFEGKKQ